MEQRARQEQEIRYRAQQQRDQLREAESVRLRAEEEVRRREEEEEESLLKSAQAARVRVEAERAAQASAQAAQAPKPLDQQSLLERMNAALRQATYVGPAPSAPPAPTRPREEKTDPHFVISLDVCGKCQTLKSPRQAQSRGAKVEAQPMTSTFFSIFKGSS